MTVQLETTEYDWLHQAFGFAWGATEYWLGHARPPSSQNSGFPFAGWNLAASADTLNVAQNSNRTGAGFP